MWKLTYELQSYLGDVMVNWSTSDLSVLKHVISATLGCIVNKNSSLPELKEVSKHLAFLGPPKVFTLLE